MQFLEIEWNQSHDTDVINIPVTISKNFSAKPSNSLCYAGLYESYNLYVLDQLRGSIKTYFQGPIFSVLYLSRSSFGVKQTYTLTDIIRTPRTIAEIAPNTSFFKIFIWTSNQNNKKPKTLPFPYFCPLHILRLYSENTLWNHFIINWWVFELISSH